MPAPLVPDVEAEVDRTLEHFNANHADTVLLLARYAAACEDATDAEAVGVDTEGVDIVVRVDGRPSTARLRFDVPVTAASDVSAQMLNQITVARANAGTKMPETSMEEETAKRGSLRTFPVSVVSNRELSPNLREIVVEGEFDGFESLGGEQFVYVFVGRDGPLPVGYSMARFMADDPTTRPLGAYYTVRAWDPTCRRMTLWFVVHGHHDGVGEWARRADVGEEIALWGPRPGFEAPAEAAAHLLIADESGFAAVAVRLDELDDHVDVTVIAETIDEAHTIPLAADGRADVRWIFRGDAEPGTGSRLIDAVRDVDLTREGLVVFGAGESRQVSEIRRLLRRERGFRAADVSMTGYWRRTPR